MIILYIVIGLLVGSIGIYFLLKPKLKITVQKNTAIENENHQLELENENLNKIKKNREELLNSVQQEYYKMDAKRQELNKTIHDLKETQQKAAEDFYNQALNTAENSFQNEVDRISDELFEQREEAKKIYLNTMKEAVADFQKEIDDKRQELNTLNNELLVQSENVSAAVAAAQRKMEMEQQQDYYRICLSDDDIVEIKRLREVLPYLRDKTPLNKVIYKVYYEKPLTDMIGRVVGPGTHTGIYKITNINSQMCYVGQAVDLANRFKQHTKRGVGAEDWTQNKLYPAMYSLGVENFTFEVVEECERSKLNEREDYWQDYFHAKDFGYSIK